jgi:hypothetical protein
MRTLVVVFSILLGILLLISALGGSLNSTERFEEYGLVDGDEPETFYNPDMPSTPKEEPKVNGPTQPTDTTSSATPPSTTEAFRNYDTGAVGDVEPYEDLDQVPSFASLSA